MKLTWDSAGEGYRYNLYASDYSDHPFFEKENKSPFAGAKGLWWARKRPIPVFLLSVKAVDSQGQESGPSNSITVDLR